MMLEEPNRTSPPYQFISHLAEQNPLMAERLFKILEIYDRDSSQKEECFRQMIDLFRNDESILHKFNANLIKERQVTCISKKIIQDMVNFLINNLSKRIADQGLMGAFMEISIDVSRNCIDNKAFFSVEELTDFFQEKIRIFDKGNNNLGEDFYNILKDILGEFKKDVEKELPVPKVKPPVEQPRPVKTIRTEPVVRPPPPEPKVAFTLHREEDIIEVVGELLPPVAAEQFNKLLYLYARGVIGFIEFVKMGGQLLTQFKKDVIGVLKTLLENREKGRMKQLPFYIKNYVDDEDGNFNKSYKSIKENGLKYVKGGLINKQYICIAHGTESTSGNEEGKKYAKNISEGLLLKIEDEMHEFDIVIHQVEVFNNFLEKMKDPSLDEKSYFIYLKRIKNLNIIKGIYGSNSDIVEEGLKERNIGVVELFRNRLVVYGKRLRETREKILPEWRDRMRANYYKAQDILSYSIKNEEKKSIEARHLLEDIKKNKFRKKNGKIRNFATIHRLLRMKGDNYTELNNKGGEFYDPVFLYNIGSKDVMADVLSILRLFLKVTKVTNIDKEKSAEVISSLLQKFFKLEELPPDPPLIVDDANSLYKELEEIEKQLLSERRFSNIDKFVLKVEPKRTESRVQAEKISKPEIEENKSQKESSEFERIIKSNSSSEDKYPVTQSVLSGNSSQRSFFGPHQFYLLYRLFFFICERFEFVRKMSLEKIKSKKLYNSFVKLLTYSICGHLEKIVYEDCLKTLFGDQAGVFFNLEKMMAQLFKVNFTGDFPSFVLELNKPIFEDKGNTENQRALFGKTCFRLSSKNCGVRGKSKMALNEIQNFCAIRKEVLRFEFNEDPLKFTVHRIKSIFQEEGKNPNNTYKKLIGKLGKVINDLRAEEKEDIIDFFVNNDIKLIYNLKRKDLQFNCNKVEDALFKRKEKTIRKKVKENKLKDFMKKRKELLKRKDV